MSVELDKSTNQSTQMAFLVIEVMAEIGKPVGLAELSRRVGVSKVRVFRFLRTLLQLGYVLQDSGTDYYRLSFKLYHLGQSLADGTDLLRDARPVMQDLSQTTGFTISLSQMEPGGMRVIDMVRTTQPVEIVTRPGALLAFHASAQGKLALAFGGAALGPLPLTAWTEDTITDPALIAAQVAQIRDQGWADAPNQTLQGVTAVSAPAFDMAGHFTATLTIAGPVQAIGVPPQPELVDQLLAAARRLSLHLGNTDKSK